MKRKHKALASILGVALAATSVFGLASCDNNTEVINAYEIAVKNGFVGDEKAWLESLKGMDGADGADLDIEALYEIAVEKYNYDGNIFEFIRENFDVDLHTNNDTKTINENLTSVVSICCAFTKEYQVGGGYFGTGRTETAVDASAGSGVIFSLDQTSGNAYIITNYHVIYNSKMGVSDCIYIYPYGALNGFSTGDTDGDGYIEAEPGDYSVNGELNGGDGIKATYVGGAMDYDVAILEVQGGEYLKTNAVSAATLGDSDSVTVGEKVYAIGNSNGYGISATEGIVSVDSENITMSASDGSRREVYYRVMRTDAAINHGNSGGALFNASGKLIGITNAKNVEDETDNMGYALPITQVKYLLQNIWDNREAGDTGYVFRAMLGVETAITGTSTRMVNGKVAVTEKFVVSKFSSTNAAANTSTKENQSLKVGDEFLAISFDGETYTTFTRRYQLIDLLLNVRLNDSVWLKVLREGVETEITIKFDRESYFTKYA